MTVEDINTFLGKDVVFITHLEAKGSYVIDDCYVLVQGVVEKITVSTDPLGTEIFVNGEWYSMPIVEFIEFKPNPSRV